MHKITVTKEKFEQVRPLLWKFHSYILSLRKSGYDIYDDSIRQECEYINTGENELNELIESVFKTGKKYDLLEFSRTHLPLSRDLQRLFNP